MVDIHSHICYGVDDGSRSLDESLAMLKIAMEGGTTDIVATPHSDLKFHFNPQLVRERIAEITTAYWRRDSHSPRLAIFI